MRDIRFQVDGKDVPLTEKEGRAALRAVLDYRRSLGKLQRKLYKREEMDFECYDMRLLGYTDAEIGRALGISARSVRTAVGRVESGRYGER